MIHLEDDYLSKDIYKPYIECLLAYLINRKTDYWCVSREKIVITTVLASHHKTPCQDIKSP